MNELLPRIRTLRQAAGLTQAALAKMSGVSSITICKYERGRVDRPRKSVLARIMAALGDGRAADARSKSASGLLTGSLKIVCPHCGASSYTFSENPEVEYKCVSCSRSFRVGNDGQGFIPPPARTPKTHEAWHRDGKGKRI